MFNQRFTVSGSSLELLNPGEGGIITKFTNTNQITIEKLMTTGVKPGIFITLEQRLPSFVIIAGHKRLVLDQGIARSIYIRITSSQLESRPPDKLRPSLGVVSVLKKLWIGLSRG
jgi:ferrous iron transport protein A